MFVAQTKVLWGRGAGAACLGIRWDGSVLEARSRQREPGPEGEPRPDSSGSRRLPAAPRIPGLAATSLRPLPLWSHCVLLFRSPASLL